jgi:hypothetical protein
MRCETPSTPKGCAVGLFMGNALILAELWPSAEEAGALGRALRAGCSRAVGSNAIDVCF